MYMKIPHFNFLILFLTLIVTCFAWALCDVAFAECYMDTPSGYGRMGGGGTIGPYASKSQCESVNSEYFGGNGTCKCPESGSSSSGSSWGSSQQNNFTSEAEIEEMMRKDRERDRRLREKRLKKEKARRLEKERIKNKIKEDTRLKFIKDKRDAMSSMKGHSRDALKIKSGTATLGLKSPNPDSEAVLKELTSAGSTGRVVSKEWKQLHCGRWASGYVFKAAQKGDVSEVRYLGNEALKAFEGGPMALDCPNVIEPPKIVYGKEIIGPNSPAVKLYKRILNDMEEYVVEIKELKETIQQAGNKKRELQIEVQDKEQEVERLKEQISKISDQAKAPFLVEDSSDEAPETQQSEDVSSDDKKTLEDAMALALAALEAAKKAESQATVQMEAALKNNRDKQLELTSSKKIFDQLGENPDLAKEIQKQNEKDSGK